MKCWLMAAMAVFAPDGLVKKGLRGEPAHGFGRRRVATDVVAGVFENEEVAVGVDGAFPGLAHSLFVAGSVVLVAHDEQRWDADAREAGGVPVIVGRLRAPRGNRDQGLDGGPTAGVELRVTGEPGIEVAPGDGTRGGVLPKTALGTMATDAMKFFTIIGLYGLDFTLNSTVLGSVALTESMYCQSVAKVTGAVLPGRR